MAIYALLPSYLRWVVLLDTPTLKKTPGYAGHWELRGAMEKAALKALEAYLAGMKPAKEESSLGNLDEKLERLRSSLEVKMESVARQAHLDAIMWLSGSQVRD